VPWCQATRTILPAYWPPTQFDRIWRIDWSNGSQGKPTLTDLPQQLMPGDSH
jgi:hypothetical protein